MAHGAPFFLGTLIISGQPLLAPADWTLRILLAWVLPGLVATEIWRRWCDPGRRLAGWWALLLCWIGWWLIHSHLVRTACDGWHGRGSATVYAVGAIVLLFGWLVGRVGRGVWTAKRWGLGLAFVVAGWLVVWPHGYVNPLDSSGPGQPVADDELQRLWEVYWPPTLPAGGDRYRFMLSGFYLLETIAVDVEVHPDGTGTLTVQATRSPPHCTLAARLVGDDYRSSVERRTLTRRQVDRIVTGFERHRFWELASDLVESRRRREHPSAPAPPAKGRRLDVGGMYHGPEWRFRARRDGSPEQGVEAFTGFSGSGLSQPDRAAWRELSGLALTLLRISDVRVAKWQLD